MNPHHAFQPREQFLDNKRFMRGLKLRNVEINAAAGTIQGVVVVEGPQDSNHHHPGRGLVIYRDVIKRDMNARRTPEAGGPLCRSSVDLVLAFFAFFHNFIRPIGPAVFKDVFCILKSGKNTNRLIRWSISGSEMGRRGVFKVRHVHGRGTVQGIESHIQWMPGASQLQPRIL